MTLFSPFTSSASLPLQGVWVWKGFPGLMSLLKQQQQHFLYQGGGSPILVCSLYYSAPDLDEGNTF